MLALPTHAVISMLGVPSKWNTLLEDIQIEEAFARLSNFTLWFKIKWKLILK